MKLYHVSTEDEMDFFFNENMEVLHWWFQNDAHYRPEYMTPLFEKLGFKVEELKQNDPKVQKAIKPIVELYY